MSAPNRLDSMEAYRLAKKIRVLARAEGRALLAIADTCAMRDGECRKSLESLSKDYKDSVRQLRYGIHGRQRKDGTVYFPGLLKRGIITLVSGGRREDGVPAIYRINLDVLRAMCAGTSAQTSAQNEEYLGTNDSEPRHNEAGTSAQMTGNLGTNAAKVLGSSKEKHKRESQASPTFSNSRTIGQSKTARVSLSEIKSWAWDISRTALFSPKSDSLIEAWLRDHSDADREALRKTIRSIVDGLDDFGLKTRGNTIASNLDRAEHDAKADANYAAEEARQNQLIDALIAKQREKSDAESREREERAKQPAPTAEQLFGTMENPR